MSATIIYEQPLNETIRACLKLEQLFRQVDHQLANTDPEQATRNLTALIISILNVLDRVDLKIKLAKELSHYQASLKRFGKVPQIDAEKLQSLTKELDTLASGLIDSNGKIGQRLRDIELLNALRLQSVCTGGGNGVDIPLYYYWLQQPHTVRKKTILSWLAEFNRVRAAVTLLLDLIRHAKFEQKTAVHGFHQELLDPQSNLRMIRIALDLSVQAYPEVSVGRHFMSIRYFSPDIEKRPAQFIETLPFLIAYCNS
ncbi:MAG: hypothetical protein A3F14_00645 [Gammaproteobacteria bacterium RIFCSPHIGHO2_12_FULL_43_28]|nr:MAG: hypothetical protein A3F14_00645 [Gammaproteobacteria bacterium RIFCSPHIGHO2_12_FULL_43_28]